MTKQWFKLTMPSHRWWHWVIHPIRTRKIHKWLHHVEEKVASQIDTDEITELYVQSLVFGVATMEVKDE